MKKVAILGFGFMGMTHAENILKNSDLDLVAIVDKNPTAVEEKLLSQTGNFATGGIKKEQILMIGHVVRFTPPYQKLKEWIDNGKYGALKFLSMSRFSGVPAWGEWMDRRTSYGSSGGALFDLLIHDIDYVNYILGIPGSIKCDYLPGLLSKHDYISAMWNYFDKDIHVKIEGGNIFHSSFPFQA